MTWLGLNQPTNFYGMCSIHQGHFVSDKKTCFKIKPIKVPPNPFYSSDQMNAVLTNFLVNQAKLMKL